jgi:predicted amidohydrolase YtcJ
LSDELLPGVGVPNFSFYSHCFCLDGTIFYPRFVLHDTIQSEQSAEALKAGLGITVPKDIGSDLSISEAFQYKMRIVSANTDDTDKRYAALELLTKHPAQLAKRSDYVGEIQAGKAADFTVLNTDVLTADNDEIAKLEPVMTVVGGAIVWSKTEN